MSDQRRPLFKGAFHLIALGLYDYYTPWLLEHTPDDLYWPIYFYLLSSILHFSASCVLHIFDWPENILPIVRKIDHSIIFVKILGTYIAYINTVCPEFNTFGKMSLYGGALLGILSRILHTDARPEIIAFPYVVVGWSILWDLRCVMRLPERLGFGFVYMLLGGLSITLGAYVYSKRNFNPWKGYIEYHEVFHILGVLSSLMFTLSIFNYAIPYYLNSSNMNNLCRLNKGLISF
jgi:hemolysin III